MAKPSEDNQAAPDPTAITWKGKPVSDDEGTVGNWDDDCMKKTAAEILIGATGETLDG